MIITFQKMTNGDWIGEYKRESLILCGKGMKLLRMSGDMCNMELSLVAKKGMTPVVLSHRSIGAEIWNWEMPSRPSLMNSINQYVGSLCFSFDDEVIDHILVDMGETLTSETMLVPIWVKFTVIPKLPVVEKFSVVVYKELRTEVTVIVKQGSHNSTIIDSAVEQAKITPDSEWTEVADSFNTDPITDIQKIS
jgi:hypothetical protein